MDFALIFTDVRNLLTNPVFLILTGFQIWMLVDAVRREEWLWAAMLLFFGHFTALFYFFMVYRVARASEGSPSFEWPGSAERERIEQLQDQIHHLDKAHHHAELGNIYVKQGKFDKALECYEAAYERDADDIDILGAYGRCLIKMNEPEKAIALLEKVAAEDPRHEYGVTLMALAQAYLLQNQTEPAQKALEQVLQHQTYAEARVMLAEIYLKIDRKDDAKHQLEEVIEDDKHAPSFVKKKDRVWSRKASQMLQHI